MLDLTYKRYIMKCYRNDLKEFLKLCKEYDFIVRQHILKTRINQINWLYLKPIFKNQLDLLFKHSHSAESFKELLRLNSKRIKCYIDQYKKDIYNLVEQYQ